MQLDVVEWSLSLTMAKFITFIADSDLELNAIKAINSIGGELALRAVSIEQLRACDQEPELTLVTTCEVNFTFTRVNVNPGMSVEEIARALAPENRKFEFKFRKGRAKVISVVGLSGGVGTTSVAINYAFEKATDSQVLLVDLDDKNPDLALALGLHRIDKRPEKISNQLLVTQGIPHENESNLFGGIYVFDLGNNLENPILDESDEILVVTRLTFNTLNRLNYLKFTPTYLIHNFFEKSSFQQQVRRLVEVQFPRMRCISIPNDLRSFEKASISRSALIEVAPNSLARKSIATLG